MKGNGKSNGTILVNVRYGFAPTCQAKVSAETIAGLPARRLAGLVAAEPQANPRAQHAARILAEVVTSGRELNFERRLGPFPQDDVPGEPIGADDVVWSAQQGAAPSQEVSVALSEPYVGGAPFVAA